MPSKNAGLGAVEDGLLIVRVWRYEFSIRFIHWLELWGTHRRIQKAWLAARSGVYQVRGMGGGLYPSQKKGIFRLKWCILVNFERYF